MTDKRMAYFKWFVDDHESMEETLTNEESGQLFHAVMAYVKDGTIRDVSEKLRYPFSAFRRKVDSSLLAYNDKCEKLAANGSKGGRQKAVNEKAKQEKAATQEVPQKSLCAAFSQKDFLDFAWQKYEDNEITTIEDCKDWELKTFYDELKNMNWRIGTELIQGPNDLITVIEARFWAKKNGINMWSDFCEIYSVFHGLRSETESGCSYADYFLTEWYEEIQKNKQGPWKIYGAECSDIYEAFKRLMLGLKTEYDLTVAEEEIDAYLSAEPHIQFLPNASNS